MSTQDAKALDTALQGALAQIERQFGKGTVMRMGDEGAQVNVEAIPTGALSLDLALGIGGMPRGRIVELYGPESSGKTTLVYHVIAEAQRRGGICAFIDAEHAMDPQYARKIGVKVDSPETTPGGRALKFYASVRLDIRRIETLKDGAEAYGNRVRVKVVKNKVAPPFKQAEFDVIYGQGIPWEGTVLDVALEKKVVQKAGSYFSFGDERLGQGRQNATN